MRNLKFIKLFEAFKSEMLSKVLGYIDTKSKKTFIDSLQEIVRVIDFPVSELKDDYFEYLPFDLALRKSVDPNKSEKIPCEYESEWISGEFCEKGKIKRTWGKGIRVVDCPNCSGKGYLEPEVKQEIKLLKFWFNKDGKFITITGSDGIKREQIDITSFSHKLEDYEEVEVLPTDGISFRYSAIEKLRSLRSGKFVSLNLSEENSKKLNVPKKLICFTEGGGSPYSTVTLHNKFIGFKKDYDSIGSKFGELSYNISSNNDLVSFDSISILKEKKKENPYEINSILKIGFKTLSLDLDTFVSEKLKDAHFSLIFDLSKLKKSEYKKRSEIIDERKERITGSLALTDPDKIRSSNINRYVSELIKRYDFDKGIQNMDRYFLVRTGSYPLFLMTISSRYIDDLEGFATMIYRFMNEKEVYRKEIASDELLYKVKNVYNSRQKIIMSEKIENFYSTIEKEKDDINAQKKEKIFSKFLELNNLVLSEIKKMKFENLIDIEFNISKIAQISSVLKSNRLSGLNLFKSVGYSMESSWKSIYSNFDYDFDIERYEEYLNDLDTFEKIIIKILK